MSQSDFSFNSQFRPLDFWSLEGPLGILWNWIRNGHNSQIKIYQKISNRNCHPYTKWIKRTRKKEDFQAVGIERTFERMYGNSQALVLCKKILTKKWRIFLVFRQYVFVHDTKKLLEAGMEFVANVTNGICLRYFWT